MESPNLKAALSLAAQGIAVFPCQTDKRPRPGLRWKEEATTDVRRIEAWWRRWPDSLPAFEPGRHKLLVTDCDRHGKGDGVAALDELAREHGDDPRDWPTIETPSTGRHIFFRQDGSLTNAKGALPAGIDIRGTGGYVIAEGATLPDGRSYHPISDGLIAALQADAVPSLPAWLAGIISTSRTIDTSVPPVLAAGGHVDRPKTSPMTTPSSSGGNQSEFFRTTNNIALQRLVDWVPNLFPRAKVQPGTGAYRVSSRDLGRDLQEDLSLAPGGIVDFGVHDMGDAREGKRTPIDVVMEHGGAPDAVAAARWLCDRLGIDAAAQWDAARAVPDIDLSRLRPKGEVATVEVVEDDDEPEDDGVAPPIDEALTHVGGILGEVIDFIVATSRRPNRRLALSAALPLCGTLLGRRMATPTDSALHLYVISTYPTGGGKQHQLDAIDRLMRSIDLQRHLGPSQFMSMSALVKHVAASPLSICAQDEFASIINRITEKRASAHDKGISLVLRNLFNCSFGTTQTPAYASTSAVDILSPALSIYGPTTPEEFYSVLRGKDLVNGFLNRFMVIDGGERVPDCQPRMSLREVPEGLRQRLSKLYRMGLRSRGNLSDYVCKNVAPDPDPLRVQWGSQDAEDCFVDMHRKIEARRESDPETTVFSGRTAEIAIRCATIRACCDDPDAPLVQLNHMSWGADLAWQSFEKMYSDASRYMVDELGYADFERKIMSKVREAGSKGMRMAVLHRHMSKHFRYAGDLKNALDALARSGIVVVEERKVPGGVSRRVRLP